MIPILFSNTRLVVADKPAGLAAIPGPAHDHDCLLRQLEAQLSQKLWVVHRLDRDVSGVIILALDPQSHGYLNHLFEQKKVQKTYLAWLHGRLSPERGLVNHPIHAFGSGRMGVDPRRGKPSETRFHVLRRHAGHTLVEAFPQTGRRHQLRVHFYFLGHPIVGDLKYGDPRLQNQFPRLLLHAWKIKFPGLDGEMITAESPIPEDFNASLD